MPDDEIDWSTGGNLSYVSDPAVVDAAFERDEPRVGTAVIGLALNNPNLDEVAPRVLRALSSERAMVREFAIVAVGDTARLFGKLTPELYEALLAQPARAREHAVRDALTFIPLRDLPPRYKAIWLRVTIRDFLQGRWIALTELFEAAGGGLKRLSRRKTR